MARRVSKSKTRNKKSKRKTNNKRSSRRSKRSKRKSRRSKRRSKRSRKNGVACMNSLQKLYPQYNFVVGKGRPYYRPTVRSRYRSISPNMKKQCEIYKNRGDGGVNIDDFKIITLEGCGYCKDAKVLLTQKNKSYKEITEDELNGDEKDQIKNFETYPKIFKYSVKDNKYELLGGYKDLCKILN